ncbi:ABC transporter ATP-binding protein [Raineyella sp. W15-4]|uniref:ABC transporter ATP-binding protein n=1 Tax=Raineyella sp. W15-4 TaxID=3081651 RepID=UPI002953FF7B|nr:ABC transporter ATP-binding protein [Raineyella sp. W15-4]WOQ15985.1 ABC transporter ATP-binding protein [Raineyella sp. W15-4]
MISVQGLTRRFGETLAVDGLTVEIGESEVFGLLGPNGAGKTTTIRMLAGLIGVTSGRATVQGVDITDRSAGPRLRRLVGVLPEEVGLYGDLSAARTLDFFARLHHVDRPRRVEQIEWLLHRLDLWERRDMPVADLSKGLKQRLALARALVHDPPVVLLDEPTANLDPEMARTVRQFLVDLGARGHVVVINTHRLEEAERICHRVGILRTRLLRVGRPAELRVSMAAGRVAVELEQVTDAVVEAARSVGAVDVTAATTQLEAHLPAEVSVPDLVTAIVLAGGRVTAVSRGETLEDAYLEIVEDHP